MTREGTQSQATMREPFLIVDDFLPTSLAKAMRQDVEAHFSAPHRHKAETHQVWNYWYVPGLYTYLRTSPAKVIDCGRVDQFQSVLSNWSSRSLGLGHVSAAQLSLYVGGCHQGVHNDSTNGRIAFVYSLTRDDRKTVGGQTLVFREGDPFRRNLRSPGAGENFYTAIEPCFNRLILFDDRMPHAVQRLEGPMDPLEGRFVLHGHISEAQVVFDGPLPPDTVMSIVEVPVEGFFESVPGVFEAFHGPFTLRLVIGADGAVQSLDVLLDRVARREGQGDDFAELAQKLLGMIREAKFPSAERETTVIMPILFGGILPILLK